MFLPIYCNNRLPQHFTRQQTLHTTSPSSKPSTPHTIRIISAILPLRRHLQNNPPVAKNIGAGINANMFDLFTTLVKSSISTVKPDIHFIFDLIYQNKLPQCIKRYFTDVYIFCLHKDPKYTTKLSTLIPTAIPRLIASHVTRTLCDKFSSHLLTFNYAVGVPNGSNFVVKAMQLSIEKFINYPQHSNKLSTHAAIFFDLTNQFNSVSRKEFFNVIETSFPKLLPLTKLFYHDKANTVHHKWDDRTWRTLLMKEGVSQGCPLSPLFALFVVARLLEPIDSLLRKQAAARLDSGDPGDDGFGGISRLLGYVDDISSCVYLPDLPFLCNTLKTIGASL